MLRTAKTATKLSCAAACGTIALLAGIVVALRSPPARAVTIGQLQQQIGAGRSRVSALSGVVGTYSSRLASLNSTIASLQSQISRLQAQVATKEAELVSLRVDLARARNRLAQLESFQAHGESVLSKQLVNTYESDQPDLLTVVLESNGFQDLLERLDFAERIQKQDVQVITAVRAARRQVAAQAVHLGALEVRQQDLTRQVMNERNTLAATDTNFVRQRLAVAQARGAKTAQLSSAQGQVVSLKQQLSQAEAAQARAAASQQAQSSGSTSSSSSAAPVPAAPAPPPSRGGFVFPLPKSAASPPSTWSPDQGVDISAPGNTPEYAVCSGTVVLHGIGGFGPWAPVLHCDTPIDGYSYVYYGHAGPENQLPVGTHVSAGQVMSSIGPGIVGLSSGPHLELGFADSSGSPIGSQTAGTMLSLLQASY